MSWLGTLKATVTKSPKSRSPLEKERLARDIIQMSGFAAATVTYAPLPVIDFIAITPIQASMVMAVGRIYGRELSMKESTSILLELASVCGAGLIARQLFTTASKFLLPGFGGIVAGPYAFAVTWAMGRTAMKYFDDPEGRRENLKKSFKDAMDEAKRFFTPEAFGEFRKKYGAKVTDFVSSAKSANGKAKHDRRRAPAKKARRKPPKRKSTSPRPVA
jgi:uncharacterized protein (DUF697 family)